MGNKIIICMCAINSTKSTNIIKLLKLELLAQLKMPTPHRFILLQHNYTFSWLFSLLLFVKRVHFAEIGVLMLNELVCYFKDLLKIKIGIGE